MIPGPPENKSVPGPRDEAPHAGRPGRRRRVRPPVRDDSKLDEQAARLATLRAKIIARREHKPE